jgi:hypothetical protein
MMQNSIAKASLCPVMGRKVVYQQFPCDSRAKLKGTTTLPPLITKHARSTISNKINTSVVTELWRVKMTSADMAVSKIGIVGAGSMGSNMALGFAEHGFKIALWDIKRENVERAKSMAKSLEAETQRRIQYFHSLDDFMTASTGDKRRVFMFSISHGRPADSVLEMMKGKLRKGDIFIDGGNEYYRTTQRRQTQLITEGVSWLGCGVSGGVSLIRFEKK